MIAAKIREQDVRRLVEMPGEGDLELQGIAALHEALDRCLYFSSGHVPEVVHQSLATRHGCVVLAPIGSARAGGWGDCVVLELPDPRAAIAKILSFVRAERLQLPLLTERVIAASATISPLTVLEGAVEIGEDVVIEPFCVIGPEVRIGRGSVVRSGVRLYPRVVVGEHSIIEANTVIGHEGYGFVRDESGDKVRMPHLAGVVIGSRVEIGPLTIVQSGVLTPTVIEDHAKVGDLIVVGHGVRIGRSASVTAGVMIGGGAVIEAEAWLGMNSTIRDGRTVGTRSLVGMDVSLQGDLASNGCARAPQPGVGPRTDDDPAAIGFTKRNDPPET